MSTPIKILLGLSLLVTLALIIAKATNILLAYKIPSGANEPTINIGDIIFVSNLVKPNRFDFISYKRYQPEYGETFLYRICGMESDTVQIKNGTLFVNGHDADKNLVLNFRYIVSAGEFNILDEKYSFAVENYFLNYRGDSVILYANKEMLRSENIKAARYFSNDDYSEEIKATFNQNWSTNNFGPVIVPPRKYFVLGDNRDNARDSRFIGFIDKDEYLGTALGKK